MQTERVYWLLEDKSIGIMPHPMGKNYLANEITALKEQAVTGLVCLLEDKEITYTGLEAEGKLCENEGIAFWHFPIPDTNAPKSQIDAHFFILDLVKHYKKKKGLVLHCYGGIGRSGTIALAVLMHLGYDLEEMKRKATLIRGTHVPQTRIQEDWLKEYKFYIGK
jgi:protein-tyrosine phosphatase